MIKDVLEDIKKEYNIPEDNVLIIINMPTEKANEVSQALENVGIKECIVPVTESMKKERS